MGEKTQITDIYKLFLSSIQDYRIKKMFEDIPNVGEELLEHFLINAVSRFTNCIKPIYDIDFTEKQFSCELDIKEKVIIKDLMVLSWLDWSINDITQMNWSLNDNDFKHFSEEKNLKEKSAYAGRLREKIDQDMMEYGLSHTPFDEWAVGNYGV